MSTPKKRSRLPATIPGDLTLVDGDRFPGSLKSPKNDTSPFEPFSDHSGSDAQNPRNQLDTEKQEGTEGTKGTASNGAAFIGSPAKNTEGTEGTGMDLAKGADPLHEADDDTLEKIDPDKLDVPCYLVRDDWFEMDGSKRKPGVWFCNKETKGKGENAKLEFKAIRICSPLHIVGLTNTEDGQLFGRLLKFRDSRGRWRTWAMPMEMLRGSCEELRGELLASGVEIEQRNRAQLADYLQWRTPKDVITAATKTGWTQNGGAFVLRDRVLGADNVYFQSESLLSEGAARVGGDYRQWRQMVGYCEGNPVLIVSLCVPLAGPLLAKVGRDSGGVHWVGDSSIGKTTALCVGASIWGGDDFKRTWRATGNGLEGVAAQLSDTCLCLDEINEADPREIGAIVYSLGNGIGKSRASRIGSARQVHRWRVTLLSTGERSIGAMMQEGGKQAKAGQLVRLLNIPAARQFGIFDTLHQFKDGRQMADYFKAESAKHYGHAGAKFVEHILQQGNADFGAILAQIETQFEHADSQAARAASRFAVYAMAGELAIEAGILPWRQGAALAACKTLFAEWRALHGSGATEHRQILQAVRDYILKHGDTRFTDKMSDQPPKTERAGWFTMTADGRVYLFTPAALREAGGSYDFNRVLNALDTGGWIVERDQDKRSKKTVIHGEKIGLYWIRPDEDSGHA
jgi:putative DNA primase/helicase